MFMSHFETERHELLKCIGCRMVCIPGKLKRPVLRGWFIPFLRMYEQKYRKNMVRITNPVGDNPSHPSLFLQLSKSLS